MAGGLRRIGIVGQVVPHKRVLEVARAFIDADTTTCQLVIVGFSSVEEPSAYEREVIRVSAPHSRITLQERTDDPNSVISQLDVLINSSVHEAFGRTIIEALASGALPVSVGGAAGPQEIIRDVGTGVVLDDFGELSDFFTAINKGGVDAAFTQRERLRRNEVAKRYSINRLAPLYLSVLGTGAHE
ncbi:glycosyltransferase family 4 protein [uncultured Gordonia sp.]|uniref:glycosyltransferase family 4 protein n=1 Tax=uncultured Gordonia sp. TaxID=198437 RepID=UPI00258C52A9|nr:glycosyltransferase family 4 protein [uncultured Gordonia sp.]